MSRRGGAEKLSNNTSDGEGASLAEYLEAGWLGGGGEKGLGQKRTRLMSVRGISLGREREQSKKLSASPGCESWSFGNRVNLLGKSSGFLGSIRFLFFRRWAA
jgi:hypothetical protein